MYYNYLLFFTLMNCFSLKNEKRTCYLISCVQLLMGFPEFVGKALSENETSETLEYLVRFIQAYKDQRDTDAALKSLRQHLGKRSVLFRDPELQQDCTEAIRLLLQPIQEEMEMSEQGRNRYGRNLLLNTLLEHVMQEVTICDG